MHEEEELLETPWHLDETVVDSYEYEEPVRHEELPKAALAEAMEQPEEPLPSPIISNSSASARSA